MSSPEAAGSGIWAMVTKSGVVIVKFVVKGVPSIEKVSGFPGSYIWVESYVDEAC